MSGSVKRRKDDDFVAAGHDICEAGGSVSFPDWACILEQIEAVEDKLLRVELIDEGGDVLRRCSDWREGHNQTLSENYDTLSFSEKTVVTHERNVCGLCP